MQVTHVYAQYQAFLIKCIKGNKMKKVTLIIDKMHITMPITKRNDYFINVDAFMLNSHSTDYSFPITDIQYTEFFFSSDFLQSSDQVIACI